MLLDSLPAIETSPTASYIWSAGVKCEITLETLFGDLTVTFLFKEKLFVSDEELPLLSDELTFALIKDNSWFFKLVFVFELCSVKDCDKECLFWFVFCEMVLTELTLAVGKDFKDERDFPPADSKLSILPIDVNTVSIGWKCDIVDALSKVWLDKDFPVEWFSDPKCLMDAAFLCCSSASNAALRTDSPPSTFKDSLYEFAHFKAAGFSLSVTRWS